MNYLIEFREQADRRKSWIGFASSGVTCPPASIADTAFSVEPPRDAAHGDVATNAAMVLAKQSLA